MTKLMTLGQLNEYAAEFGLSDDAIIFVERPPVGDEHPREVHSLPATQFYAEKQPGVSGALTIGIHVEPT